MPALAGVDPLARVLVQWDRGLAPAPRVTVPIWATERRQLTSKSGAGSGRWDNGVTPYLIEPMETMTVHHPAQLCAVQGPSQFGKTDGLIGNVIGYRIDVAPTSIVLIQPTVDMGKNYSRQKFDPMIEGTECLRGKIHQRKSRDAGNTALFKDFPGGLLVIGGANSPARLRQTSAGLVIGDDIDAFPVSAGKEGDPWELLRARQRSYEYFGHAKALAVSSPGPAPSRIVTLVNSCERVSVWVEPCPFCNDFIELKRKRHPGDRWGLVYEMPTRAEDVGERLPEVSYLCPTCGRLIGEEWQHPMINAGKYLVIKDRPNPLSFGFRLPGLCARFRSWGATAASEARAELTNDAENRKTVVCTMYGEEYREPTEAPAWEPLYQRRESYPVNIVPIGGLLLTAGVDVQMDRLEVELIAWGFKLRTWSVNVLVIPGDIMKPEVWWDLDDVLAAEYQTAWGTSVPIACMAVDSGYSASVVYRWARGVEPALTREGTKRRRPRWPDFGRPDRPAIMVRHPRTVLVAKGTGGWDRILSLSKKADAAERDRGGLKVVSVGDALVKSEFYGWLRNDPPIDDAPEPAGFCHWPDADVYDEDHFQQMVSESVEVYYVNGQPRRKFVLPAHTRNERLDLRMLNRVAAAAVGVDRYTNADWERLARRLKVPADAIPARAARVATSPATEEPTVEASPAPPALEPPAAATSDRGREPARSLGEPPAAPAPREPPRSLGEPPASSPLAGPRAPGLAPKPRHPGLGRNPMAGPASPWLRRPW